MQQYTTIYTQVLSYLTTITYEVNRMTSDISTVVISHGTGDITWLSHRGQWCA